VKGHGEAGGGSQGGGGADSGAIGGDGNAARRPSGGRAAGWRSTRHGLAPSGRGRRQPWRGPPSRQRGHLMPNGARGATLAAEAMMPGMRVTLSTAMRVRDVSRPSPQDEDNARAKVAEWPAARARPAPAPPPGRGRKGNAAPPRPWRPGADRGETSAARTGGGPRKGQGRPTPQAPRGTGPRPAPVPHDAAQGPQPKAAPARQPPPAPATRHSPAPATQHSPAPATQRPPALPAGRDEVRGPVPARGKRVRRRRRRGQAGG
jgi:DNA polymerase-3 subunit gamma/tau